MKNTEQIKKGDFVFVRLDGFDGEFYGAKVVGVAENHYRVYSYYGNDELCKNHNVAKHNVMLQDGQ